ncbi:MAG: DUF1926 domain-containing protein [Chloroflexi bacterium]|nr:DUF1926 domain-containing protein [Chloroflexota bacterium]
MKKIHLALALHNHQPVGNFDFVFAEAYAKAYLPMIELLEKHPRVKLALHYTGPLRDWIVAHQPDLFARIRALVARNQVEVMSGGYYEPILAAIPDADKRGQIQKLTRAVKDDFGYAATGLWLAERVWEPHLAKPLADAGIAYTIVDDTHFKYVGLSDDDLFGYYVTEEQGTTLKIFGTSKHLRYTIPWSPVEELIAWLRDQASEDGARVAVMGDDGEKFGLWPHTFEHCWTQGWMEKFFTALEENQDWLHTITLADYSKKFPAIGRIYLPTASYDEMTEWALPAKLSGEITALKHRLADENRGDILRFIKGAFWRNFLVKYPEVNSMHKKMLRVSEKVDAVTRRHGDTEMWAQSNLQLPTSNFQSLISNLQSHLYAGQCNCPYWHGVFGGIYLSHIRAANYAHLIQAETLADQITHGDRDWVDAEETDFDKDSVNELLVSGNAMNLYFDLARGGALFEWDWRAKKLNLHNTLSRRAEGYHRDLIEAAKQDAVEYPGAPKKENDKLESIHSTVVRAKEPGLEKQLNYDWYRRVGLIDHFIHPQSTLDDFARAQHNELGDFVNQPYTARVEKNDAGLIVTLARDGHVWQGNVFAPLHIEKRLTIRAGAHHLPLNYLLTNTSAQTITARFGVEFCFALLAGHSPDAYYRANPLHHSERSEAESKKDDAPLDSRGEIPTDQIALVNEWLGIEIALKFKSATRVWRAPVETISLSEAGFERVYQASCVMPVWEIALKPGETREIAFEIALM